MQNFRPGAMERNGVGYEDLKKINKDLIYVSSSGKPSALPHLLAALAGRKVVGLAGRKVVGLGGA